jgi:D-alanyl-lipoteichoic acid acyltransferase DltB (MBOAT superfamily)
MTTMLLGGLWHGASWTFVLWGGLHGAYLVAHHAWTGAAPRLANIRPASEPDVRPGRLRPAHAALVVPARRIAAAMAVTVAVSLAWVFFRAPDLDTARLYFGGLLAFSPGGLGALMPLLLLALCTLAIDVPQARADDEFVFLKWHPAAKAVATAGAAVLLLMLNDTHHVPFIYFQF